jgi:hypothetical protein
MFSAQQKNMSLKFHVLSFFMTCIASRGRAHGPVWPLTSFSSVSPLRIAAVFFFNWGLSVLSIWVLKSELGAAYLTEPLLVGDG